MDYTRLAIKSLLESLKEFNLHLENIQSLFKSKNNHEIDDLFRVTDDISKLKELEVKLIRSNDVY